MSAGLWIRGVLAGVLLLCLSACAGNTAGTAAALDASAADRTAESPLDALLPAPGDVTLRPASALGPSSANEYINTLPRQHITPQHNGLDFAPAEGGALSSCALACYLLAPPVESGALQLELDWITAPLAGSVWIGLADWASGRWRFVPLKDKAAAALPEAWVHSDTDHDFALIALLVSGAGHKPRLGSLGLSALPQAPEILAVTPSQFQAEELAPISATVSGYPPPELSWNFGSHCVPQYSGESAPLLWFEEPGPHECQLVASNAAGTDTIAFTLNVSEAAPGRTLLLQTHSELADLQLRPQADGALYVVQQTGSGRQHIMHISAAGELDWGRTLYYSAGVELPNHLVAVELDGAGGLYTLADYGLLEFGSGLMLSRVSAQGELLWSRRVDTERHERGIELCVDSERRAWLIAANWYNLEQGMPQPAAQDTLLLRFSPAGVLEWTAAYDAGMAEMPIDAAVDSAGRICVMGSLDESSEERYIFSLLPQGIPQSNVRLSGRELLRMRAGPEGSLLMVGNLREPPYIARLESVLGPLTWEYDLVGVEHDLSRCYSVAALEGGGLCINTEAELITLAADGSPVGALRSLNQSSRYFRTEAGPGELLSMATLVHQESPFVQWEPLAVTLNTPLAPLELGLIEGELELYTAEAIEADSEVDFGEGEMWIFDKPAAKMPLALVITQREAPAGP